MRDDREVNRKLIHTDQNNIPSCEDDEVKEQSHVRGALKTGKGTIIDGITSLVCRL